MYAFLRALLLVLLPTDEVNGLHSSVAAAGDVDGDGVPDFALAQRGPGATGFGEPAEQGPLELVWILSGKDGSLLRTLRPPRACQVFGQTLENVGDLDGDGRVDLAVSGADHVWVFSGADGKILHELAGGAGFGYSMSGALDVDGDGGPDLAVYEGAWHLLPSKGCVKVFNGRSGSLIHVLSPASLGARSLTGAIGLVPDRDGDGRAELALTLGGVRLDAPDEDAKPARGNVLEVVDPETSKSFLRYVLPEKGQGGQPWLIRSPGDLDGDGVAELLVSLVHDHVILISGARGEELQRHSWVEYYMNAEGTSLEVHPDADGDGVPDYLVGANEDGFDCDPGFVALYSGRNGSVLSRLQFDYDGEGSCGPGADACVLGDVDGDGVHDVAVHLPRLDEIRILSGADFAELVRRKVGDAVRGR